MKLDSDILTTTVAAIPEIAACYLFGSAAQNESVVNDIDLLILVYPEADAEKVLWTATEKISDALSLPADMLDILLFDLTMANPKILYAAVTNGILIKNASPDLLGDRIESISLYFLENEPVIQRAKRLNREMIKEICDIKTASLSRFSEASSQKSPRGRSLPGSSTVPFLSADRRR